MRGGGVGSGEVECVLFFFPLSTFLSGRVRGSGCFMSSRVRGFLFRVAVVLFFVFKQLALTTLFKCGLGVI